MQLTGKEEKRSGRHWKQTLWSRKSTSPVTKCFICPFHPFHPFPPFFLRIMKLETKEQKRSGKRWGQTPPLKSFICKWRFGRPIPQPLPHHHHSSPFSSNDKGIKLGPMAQRLLANHWRQMPHSLSLSLERRLTGTAATTNETPPFRFSRPLLWLQATQLKPMGQKQSQMAWSRTKRLQTSTFGVTQQNKHASFYNLFFSPPFTDSKICGEGGKAIAEALRTNTSVTDLNLSVMHRENAANGLRFISFRPFFSRCIQQHWRRRRQGNRGGTESKQIAHCH